MKNNPKKWVVVIFIMLAYGQSIAARLPLVTNGVNWGINYYNPDSREDDGFDKIPTTVSEKPLWVNYGVSKGKSFITNSYLRIETSAGQTQGYKTSDGWDLKTSGTVEVVLRVVESTGSMGAGSMLFANGSIYTTLIFSSDCVRVGSIRKQHDFSKWSTVRITFENMDDESRAELKVYVDGNMAPLLKAKTWYKAGVNEMRFGDLSTTSIDGIVEWDSIRWSSAGAFAPNN